MRRSSKIAIAVATVAAAALAVVVATPRSADAATATSSFTVTANVVTACTIGSANITASYDPNLPSATTATGAVTLHCTRGTHYDVGLASSHAWTLVSTAGDSLNYSILKDATTVQWTNTGAGLVSGTAATFATPVTLVATASIPSGQDVPAGSYSDTVTATVTF
jgi:spore coat protein U-like protein